MQMLFRATLMSSLTLFLTACEGPFFLMPGGALSGTVSETPASWQFEEASGLAQLETRPEDPYSINLAYVQLDGKLYVYAGNTRTTWVEHIERNPLIRIRVGERIYSAVAVRVENEDEISEFAAQWAGRSVFQRDPMQFEEIWLYRVEVR